MLVSLRKKYTNKIWLHVMFILWIKYWLVLALLAHAVWYKLHLTFPRIHRDSCDCGIRTLQILLLILTLWKDGQRWLTCSYEDTWAWIMVWRNQSVEGSVHAFKWYKIVLALKICMKWISLKLFPIAFWVLYTHPYLSTLWNPIIRMSL